MRSRVLSGIALAAVAALALAACSSSGQQSAQVNQTTTAGATPQTTMSPGATAETTASPGATVKPTATMAGGEKVSITVNSTAITPAQATFKAKTPYHFTVTNKGTTASTCLIGPAGMTNMTAQQRQAAALVKVPALEAGKEYSFTFTFPEATANKKFELACYNGANQVKTMQVMVTP